jgi:Holliday junction resolvasome RuvABC endonuclease subunit
MAKAILGISPGTRIIGLAIIQKGELVEWKVMTFKQMWSADKRKAILATIDKLCDYHGIQVLVVKTVDPLRSSPDLDTLVAAIVRQAERRPIKVKLYSLSDLDYNIQTGKKQTKEGIREQVANRHPELKNDYLKERNNRREYYTKMFEAIAMAEQYKEI